jgi:hypothetical protein
LISVHLRAESPPKLSSLGFTGNADGRKFYVPAANESDYETALVWKDFGAASIFGE